MYYGNNKPDYQQKEGYNTLNITLIVNDFSLSDSDFIKANMAKIDTTAVKNSIISNDEAKY